MRAATPSAEAQSRDLESPQSDLPCSRVAGCFRCGAHAVKCYRGASRRWWKACEKHRRSVALSASWDRRRHGLPGRYSELETAGLVH